MKVVDHIVTLQAGFAWFDYLFYGLGVLVCLLLVTKVLSVVLWSLRWGWRDCCTLWHQAYPRAGFWPTLRSMPSYFVKSAWGVLIDRLDGMYRTG